MSEIAFHSYSAATVRDYWDLLKPRVMVLVVFTGFAGLALAWEVTGAHIHPVLAATAVLCIAMAAGAAGAINMYLERDIDALMVRTQDRPLPAGRVDPAEALALGITFTLFSVMLMGLALNWLAAGLLAFTTFFYVVIYTLWLKPRTPQNIVIGGAAGAFPPMIGWAAVTGGVSVESLVLFLIIFMWTPPHFWALALCSSADYRRAGIPMMPVVAGARHTKVQMLVYTLALVPVTLAPYMLGMAGAGYALAALALNAGFVFHAVRVLRSAADAAARRMFGYSLFYLFGIFALLLVFGGS